MTNIYPDRASYRITSGPDSWRTRQQGAATLILTVILLVAAVLIIIYAANHSLTQQKTSSNLYANNQAYEAAEAGLEFGIQYLSKNAVSILASPAGGFINYGPANASITNVTQGNNSRFSIVYTNPTANNYDQIWIAATGTSTDGSSSRTVRQLVQKKPLLITLPVNPSSILGRADLQGSANVTNLQGNTTIVAGSTISFKGSASTTTTTGGSDKNTTGADIQPNSPSLNGMSADQFFQTYFGTSMATIKNMVATFYPSGSSPSLDGVTGTSIWVDQDYSETGNATIGSGSAPVLLIVNGNFNIGGTVTIYGFVFATGNISSSNGTPEIIGGFASAGNLSLQGNPSITYDNSVLNATIQSTAIYAKIPGSWKDF
ncbi:hypothetical protein AQUSIP_08740 [Aquicella siphonis]|uniref:Type 4 fimbrial biogenesis protein PilX N-terminal domain-containing protein n=1 Tax=Aquicella siphonis TaxID=254247 RepID=A0A5E4PFG5_9COXI|nr:PilX N-terminal domain-containing pilus assembly protein [Aquicella siphonis]VVC75584.1 hypothetical protein AQUSIP_08740 [Aquicella siphonis]